MGLRAVVSHPFSPESTTRRDGAPGIGCWERKHEVLRSAQDDIGLRSGRWLVGWNPGVDDGLREFRDEEFGFVVRGPTGVGVIAGEGGDDDGTVFGVDGGD